MKHEIVTMKNRFPFIQEYMGTNKARITGDWTEDMVVVEVIIDDPIDALNLFHAGIKCGRAKQQLYIQS